MASGKLVFTGNYGPGLALVARNFTNLNRIEFDFDALTVTMYGADANNRRATQSLQYDTIATFTAAIAAGVSTLTLS